MHDIFKQALTSFAPKDSEVHHGGAGMSQAATRIPDNPVVGAVKSVPPLPMMTREQAAEMVDDLIQAYWDYENNPRRSYREDYEAKKRQVIDALSSVPSTDQRHSEIVEGKQS